MFIHNIVRKHASEHAGEPSRRMFILEHAGKYAGQARAQGFDDRSYWSTLGSFRIAANATLDYNTISTQAAIRAHAANIVGECADVVIVLYQIAEYCGVDLHGTIDQKMTINRKRRSKTCPPVLEKSQHTSPHISQHASDRETAYPVLEYGAKVTAHCAECSAVPDTQPVEPLPSTYKPLQVAPRIAVRGSENDPARLRTVDRASLHDPMLRYLD